MAYLEFPKVLRRFDNAGAVVEEQTVADAQAEAVALAAGFVAPPPPPPETEAQRKASPTYLEYPKVLYQGGVPDGEQKTVADADGEAAAAADGFVSLAVAPVDDEVPAADDTPKRKPGRPKKAAE